MRAGRALRAEGVSMRMGRWIVVVGVALIVGLPAVATAGRDREGTRNRASLQVEAVAGGRERLGNGSALGGRGGQVGGGGGHPRERHHGEGRRPGEPGPRRRPTDHGLHDPPDLRRGTRRALAWIPGAASRIGRHRPPRRAGRRAPIGRRAVGRPALQRAAGDAQGARGRADPGSARRVSAPARA